MGYPLEDMEPVEVLWDGDDVPFQRTWNQWKYYGMEMGYPTPAQLWTDKQTENISFAILRMQAVITQRFY